uniref:SGNH hydrolase-type esterase domain-containing protein n=1 Tax=Callorhinchus milii TaxID=7868 RepID=A0A4W3H0G8_CALMI
IRELQLRVAELESQVETLRSIRDGENFLDIFILEPDTPLSPKEEECSSDGHDWVAVRRAGKRSRKRGAEESQTLINLRHEGEDPIVMVHHIGTNDIGRTSRDELRSEFPELGIKLRNRTSKVMISGLLPEPGANWYRQKKIIDLNAWLKEWCGEQEFQFMGHWREYWGRWELFQRKGLHLNRAGTNVLATRINKELHK